MAHPNKSRFRGVLVGGGAIVLLVALLCSVYLLRPAIRARYLLRELERLQVGHSTYEDAQRLASKIGAKPTGYASCDRSYCEWAVRIGNSKLPQWWRGSGETFGVSFAVKDSFVERKGAGYAIGVETGTFFPSEVSLEEQENWGHTPRPKPVTIGGRRNEQYPYLEVRVFMKPEASAEDRHRYSAYNFNCFWKYKGCKDARELLPTLGPDPWATEK
jgi:hypothetical protein